MDKIWNNFPDCECLKILLINTGFESLTSLKCINRDLLIEVKKNIEKNRNILQTLACDHKSRYLGMDKFEFLPGHYALLLDWCQNQLCNLSTDTFNAKHSAFSPILSELINSALSNHKKPAKSHRFSEVLVDFSIYIFIMAGKACYETLSLNLPIPKAGTICKGRFVFLLIFFSTYCFF